MTSRAGETDGNATAEAFFSRYKAELLEGGAFADVPQARAETYAHVKGTYERKLRHSCARLPGPRGVRAIPISKSRD